MDITVTGANSASGTATTGSRGQLGFFTYTPARAGVGTVTATIGGKSARTAVTILAAQNPHLFQPIAQRTHGNHTFLFSVRTDPSVVGARVNLFAVYHPGKTGVKYLHAGNGTTAGNGRAARATSPGYLVNGQFKTFKPGTTYNLAAKVAGGETNMVHLAAK